jgi:hypothetical protein
VWQLQSWEIGMSWRLVTAVLVVMAAASGPALACKGPTLIFSDDFKTADPAWVPEAGTLNITGGMAQLNAQPGNFAAADYEGFFLDSADACVDMTAPVVKDPTTILGGILFGFTDSSNFYSFVVRADGNAAIFRLQNGGWLTPVPMRAAQGVKTGANAVNTLRVTWKGTAGTAYINDQQFIAFKIQPLTNSTFGIYCQPAGDPYQFSNIKVTNVP